jgi:hypothetical protein
MRSDELESTSPALYALLYLTPRADLTDVQRQAREELERLLRAEAETVVHETLYHAITLPLESAERRSFAEVGAWLAARFATVA